MRDSNSHGTRSSDAGGLTMTRRAAMALLGVGTLAGASGVAAAQEEDDDNGNDNEPTRKWNQHVDAQDYDLRNVGEFDASGATLGNVRTAARDADVLVWQGPEGTYHADGVEETVYSGENFTEAVQAAVDSLTDGRTTKEKVVVACSGTMGPHEWDGDVLAIDIPSYTIVDFRGTIYVEDENEALIRPLRALNAEEIEIPRVAISGNFRSAIWFRSVSNVYFGHVDIRTPEDSIIEATGGGVRIDGFAEGRGDDTIRSTDIQVDTAYIENTVGHAFETYAVDRLQVGEVVANNPNYAGVLLNDTTDTTVGAVVGKDVDVGGGYATFRVANGAHDVTCGQVVANGGARGVFGVSGCHDITIGEVNIRHTDAHGMLIQDCQRFTVQGGILKDCKGEAIRVDSRSSDRHDPAEAVSISNVRVVDTQDEKTQTFGIKETGPETANNRFVDNDLRDAGTEANMSLFAPSSVVRDNLAGGVDHGTVTLSSGASPAARVEGVTDQGGVTLDLRAKPRTAPGGAFAYDHHFEWTGDQWNLVVEWTADPGEDVDLDYIVDRPQANIGVESSGDDGGGGDGGSDVSWDYDTSPGVVDDFEDGDIDEYEGSTGDYTVNQDAPVPSGSYRLEGTGGENSKLLASDLDRMPAEGTKFSAKIGWTDAAQNACFAFGGAKSLDADSSFPFHFIRMWKSGEDDWRFQFWSRDGTRQFEKSLGATTPNAFYEVVVDWKPDEVVVTLNDPDGNELTTQTTELDTEFTEGGIGTRGTGLLDDVRVLEDNT
ncbi:RICIN domain-containing protein [Halosimplex amylolyticum]|uniref:RICIN domain-containing protein n=1 Tax=Halosimplex amylolyticum TaxID=3396616 RepID=UPI003F5498F3